MIKFIQGSYASFFPREIAAMFKNRALTFKDRLGWDVVVKDGMEKDKFDDCNPLYLLSVDPDTDEYWGSLRLLPTTGPNMLRDVFSQLLQDGYGPETVESATIWESSRICAECGGQCDSTRVLKELLLGIGEVCLIAGLTQIVSVFDARVFRILNRLVGLDIIGEPQKIGGIMCYAALFDTSGGEMQMESLYDKLEIGRSILAPGASFTVEKRNIGG